MGKPGLKDVAGKKPAGAVKKPQKDSEKSDPSPDKKKMGASMRSKNSDSASASDANKTLTSIRSPPSETTKDNFGINVIKEVEEPKTAQQDRKS